MILQRLEPRGEEGVFGSCELATMLNVAYRGCAKRGETWETKPNPPAIWS